MASFDDLVNALSSRDYEGLRAALDAGAPVNGRDQQRGYTALHVAAQNQDVEATRALLAAGADVNATDSFGNEPLWTATFNCEGDGTVIGELRAAGSDPLHRNTSGKSPVDIARLIANYPIAQFFEDLP